MFWLTLVVLVVLGFLALLPLYEPIRQFAGKWRGGAMAHSVAVVVLAVFFLVGFGSYLAMGRPDAVEARAALAEYRELAGRLMGGGDDPLSGPLSGRDREPGFYWRLLQRLGPDIPEGAGFLMGLAAAKEGAREEARKIWLWALTKEDSSSPWAEVILVHMTKLGLETGRQGGLENR